VSATAITVRQLVVAAGAIHAGTLPMVRSNLAYILYPALLCGAAFVVPGFFATACVGTTQITESAGGAGGGRSTGVLGGGDDGTICVLHNCKGDSDCGACSEGRKVCSLRDHRCVSCDVLNGSGCADGEVCSDFGSCVPMGLTCVVDDHGVPSSPCTADVDCAACDPTHQVCDPATSKCVACTQDNTRNCMPGEQCTALGECGSACPNSCSIDDDCAPCAGPTDPAFSCASGKCVLKSTSTTSSTGTSTTSSTGSSTSGGGGTCHDYCIVGPALDPSCDLCAKAVCDKDSFCCEVKWDGTCVSEVGQSCNKTCTGLPPSTCSHNECVAGVALTSDCSACAGAVCNLDSFCCKTTWDTTCIGEVADLCGIACK
jgi:hypothetical protein